MRYFELSNAATQAATSRGAMQAVCNGQFDELRSSVEKAPTLLDMQNVCVKIQAIEEFVKTIDLLFGYAMRSN